MNHPKITKEEKISFIENVFDGKIDRALLGFIVTIVEKDRYSEIKDILNYVVDSIKEYSSIGTAYVTTAISLNEKEVNEVRKRLLETTKYKEIELIKHVRLICMKKNIQHLEHL